MDAVVTATDGGSDVDVVATARCSACGADLLTGAKFCEACGAATHADPGGLPGGCNACGGEIGDDGYCTTCGHRALEPITVDDRGRFAYATHRGRRHSRNEDAGALALTSEGWPVLVVADGVSASPNPHLAAAAAVTGAATRLAGRAFNGADDLVEATAAAQEGASAVSPDGDPNWAADTGQPACTLVIAVATDTAIYVANIGDARAYLLAPKGNTWDVVSLTTDDSVAAEAVDRGVAPAAALALPDGHAITAWLGADAPTLNPHIATRACAPGDIVLACSDGLWNYAPTTASVAAVAAAAFGSPDHRNSMGEACERLVAWAIEQGGSDNICVAASPVDKQDRVDQVEESS